MYSRRHWFLSLGAAFAMLWTSACTTDRGAEGGVGGGSPDAGAMPIDPVPDDKFDPINRVLKGSISLFDEQGKLQESRPVSVDIMFPHGIHSPETKAGNGYWDGSFWLGNGTFENEVMDGPYFVFVALDKSGKSREIATQLSRDGDCPYEITKGIVDPMVGEFRGHARVIPRCRLDEERGQWDGDFILRNSGQDVPLGRMVVLNREPVVPNGVLSIQFTLEMARTSGSRLNVQSGSQEIEGEWFDLPPNPTWRAKKALVPNAPIIIHPEGFIDVSRRQMTGQGGAEPATTTASISDLSLATEPPAGALWHAGWSPGGLTVAPGAVDGLVTGLISLGAPSSGETKLRIRMTQRCVPGPAPMPISGAVLVDSRGEVTPVEISCDAESEAVSVALPGEGPIWLSIAGQKPDTTGMAVITIRELAFEP